MSAAVALSPRSKSRPSHSGYLLESLMILVEGEALEYVREVQRVHGACG
jgi:hypothetical protein